MFKINKKKMRDKSTIPKCFLLYRWFGTCIPLQQELLLRVAFVQDHGYYTPLVISHCLVLWKPLHT